MSDTSNRLQKIIETDPVAQYFKKKTEAAGQTYNPPAILTRSGGIGINVPVGSGKYYKPLGSTASTKKSALHKESSAVEVDPQSEPKLLPPPFKPPQPDPVQVKQGTGWQGFKDTAADAGDLLRQVMGLMEPRLTEIPGELDTKIGQYSRFYGHQMPDGTWEDTFGNKIDPPPFAYGHKVWSVSFTPELRAKILKEGFPLYSIAPFMVSSYDETPKQKPLPPPPSASLKK